MAQRETPGRTRPFGECAGKASAGGGAEGAAEAFSARITELTAGGVSVAVTGEQFRGVPRKNVNKS